MIISRSIYAASNGLILFFFMAESYSVVCIYHFFFIWSSVNGHLNCFHILATVNHTAVNTELHASFQIIVFLSIC